MAKYEYIEQFLDVQKGGLSEKEALVQVAYEQGLITKQEMSPLIEHLSESGARLPENWTVPTDTFERVVFLTAWDKWVECIVSKLMHNAIVFNMMDNDPEQAKGFSLIHNFPSSLDELSLEHAVKALMQDKTGEERCLIVQVNVLNRRSLFAIQCMLPLPQREIRKILKENQQVAIILRHSGNGKFTKLKNLMHPYGLELRLTRLS